MFLKKLIEGSALWFDNSIDSMKKIRLEINKILRENTEKNFCSKCSYILIQTDFLKGKNCFHKYHKECLQLFDLDLENFNCPQCVE